MKKNKKSATLKHQVKRQPIFVINRYEDLKKIKKNLLAFYVVNCKTYNLI